MAYTTAADVRSRYPLLSSTDTYPTATLEDHIAQFETIAEDYCGVAFEPRTATETFRGCDRTRLTLPHRRVRSITSVTIDGTAAAADTYMLDGGGILYRPAGLGTTWDSTVVVVYEHGYTEPPTPILQACREYVRAAATKEVSGVPRDIIATSMEGVTTRYSTPDKKAGRPTGWIDVDRLLNSVPDRALPGIA